MRTRQTPSRGTFNLLLIEFEYIVEDVFDRFVKQTAVRGTLNSIYSIDSTHIEEIQYSDVAS
jgi:hypothetical protein